MILVYMPLELTSLYYGYYGNIKETFPEVIAFLTFTVVFVIPINVGIYLQNFLFPLEYSCMWVQGVFNILELFFGLLTIVKIMKMQEAVFYMRNAPLIDSNFETTMGVKNSIRTSREVGLGIKKY